MTLLVILFIAFGLMLGFFTKGQALRKLGRVLLIAAFVPIFIGVGKGYFYQLSSGQKLIFAVAVSTVGIFVVLRILLGKDLFNEVMGRFIYDGLKAIFLLPFRIIGKFIRNLK